MKSRVEETIARHDKGYNCAQAVVCTYCDLLCILPALDSSPDTDPCSNLKARSKTGITAPADTRDII